MFLFSGIFEIGYLPESYFIVEMWAFLAQELVTPPLQFWTFQQ
jgi:hypothetical protein